MANKAVPLHFTEPQAALPGPAFGGLSCKYLDRTPGAHMMLACNHVMELLIEDDAHKDFGLYGPARLSIEPALLAVVLESICHEAVPQCILAFP